MYDWQATTGSRGQCLLDTLFVKLVNPPQTVQLDSLPENVVPLIRTTMSTQCLLPNNTTISISRSQVEVLPNFAITDYTSQGKTRIHNPVDLSSARSHQSYCQRTPQSTSHHSCLLRQSPIHPSTQTTEPLPAARDPTVVRPMRPTYASDLRVRPTCPTYVSNLRVQPTCQAYVASLLIHPTCPTVGPHYYFNYLSPLTPY